MKNNLNNAKAFSYSVPFYLYIPKILQYNIHYDKNRVGSHKDVFPTLYNISLSNVEYISMGGRNILGLAKNEKLEFGINDALWIDDKGVYITNKGYFFEKNTSIKNTSQEIILDKYHKEFHELYYKINWWQLNKRLNNK
nr:hypothetical protein [Campylobacter lari]